MTNHSAQVGLILGVIEEPLRIHDIMHGDEEFLLRLHAGADSPEFLRSHTTEGMNLECRACPEHLEPCTNSRTPALISNKPSSNQRSGTYLHVGTDAEEEAEVDAEGADVCAGLAADPEDAQMPFAVVFEELALVDGAHTKLALHGTDEWRALYEGDPDNASVS